METIHFKLGDSVQIEPLTLAIGYFDGIHKGHQALVMDARQYALEHHCKCGMMTFSPNPAVVTGKLKTDNYLTSIQDKAEILEQLGADYLIVVEFTEEVCHLSPRDFFDAILKVFPIQMIVCGFDFHFGFKGAGSGETLKEFASYPVYIQDKVTDREEKISTTRINKALITGNFEDVNRLLGRPYKIEGQIIKGRQIGRTIGFRTANVEYGAYRIPELGVYAVVFEVDGKKYTGMANIGYNPTFNALNKPSLEVNIFDFDEDIYGKRAKVYFYHMIRPETRFSSPQALINQLHRDQNSIKEYFNEHSVL